MESSKGEASSVTTPTIYGPSIISVQLSQIVHCTTVLSLATFYN